jgi:hypothetical protein
LDQQLGIAPHQQTSLELKKIDCGLAVFVPFEIAALLLGQWLPVRVSAEGIWGWVQQMGQRDMTYWQAELERFAAGDGPVGAPPPQPDAPLLIGGDGVMVPFRREAGSPKGPIRWQEVKIGIVAWWTAHTTRSGKTVPRLTGRRLTAVLGDIDDLIPRLHLTAVLAGWEAAAQVAGLSDGGLGFWSSTTTCLPLMLSAFWISIMPPNISGKPPPLGGMGAPNRLKIGSSNPAINCAMARRMPSSRT